MGGGASAAGLSAACSKASEDELKQVFSGLDAASLAKLSGALAKPAAEPKKCEIYGVTGSMNAMGPALLAAHLGILDMKPTMPGEATNTPEFLAINPFHQIPAMKDGDFCMAESGAMLRYLALAYNPELYPKDAKMRGFIDWAIDRFSGPMYKDCYKTIYPVLGYTADPEDKEAAGKLCTQNLEEWAKLFLQSKFVGGDKPSIADYKVAPFFFCWEHPALKFVDCPERILQFNKDFKEACKGYDMLLSAGGWALKEMLDKAAASSNLQGGAGFSGTSGETVAAKKTAGKCEIYGVTGSMNCMGPVLLAMAYGVGEVKPTMPGEATNTPEFLAMNPFHQVPTMKDGDFCLAESNAILRYIAACYAPETYPEDAKARGFIDWAIDRFSSAMYPDCVGTIYPVVGYAAAPEDQEAAGKKCSANLEEFAKVFLKKKFVGGDKLSIADYKVAPFFFCWGHDVLKTKAHVACPARIAEFNKDFKDACKPEAFALMMSAGGWALQELLDSKA
mmetsp:Transcript_51407/g.134952  ORF Transcript_51407/g.134952 Transcript_51407/m.134952 type:complete len:505 (-) Transcript_51407:64-1578(-)|eukprot:CAMPEP_0115283290 /NCGR_PEP_ID=MMETSP0270-20121206/60293_1 /TAXON_ID=71861 /ORGANISM="Scrippsiella trochoidea, Strain CCMP3099" /LENGTH=504 /DNA_ID=CAMNT_0002700185 /DNA_START=94 /DNA_END=1608 /DNA_ORIENTATION=-